MIQHGELSSLGAMLEGVNVFDFAIPSIPMYEQNSITALLKKRTNDNAGLAFLKSFSLKVWLFFLVLFCIVVIVDAFKQSMIGLIPILKRFEFFLRATIGESYCKLEFSFQS